MTIKQNKILFIIFLILVPLLTIYFIFNIKIIKIKSNYNQAVTTKTEKTNNKRVLTPDEIKNLKIIYNQEFTLITEEYFNILKSTQTQDKEKLNKLRERMLNLVIPEEYKKTHLELVLIFAKINDLVLNNNIKEAEKLLGQAKEKYSLLKNI